MRDETKAYLQGLVLGLIFGSSITAIIFLAP
jgi:hypothetical protein